MLCPIPTACPAAVCRGSIGGRSNVSNLNACPCLRLAVEAGKKGGTYPAALSAADEVAVELFLDRKIKFTEIPRLIEKVLEKHQSFEHPDVEAVLVADDWAREEVGRLFKGV